MMLLRVLSYNGVPTDGPSAQFDEIGGTIGRADNNQLVLPDPERTISRVHARLVFRAGGYAVVDNGSNPISVNGTPLGAGREHPLRPGDKLEIGGYLIEAAEAHAAASSDPFADLFGDAPLGLAAPAAPAPPVRTGGGATATWPPPPSPAAAWPAPAPAAAPARAPAPAITPGHIPDDWDPFAPDTPEAPPLSAGAGARAASAPAPEAPFAGLPGAADSLDDLFGLANAPAAADPLGASPAQAALAQPNMASGDDALLSLARTATIMPPSQADHFSELNTPMPLPVARAPAPAPSPSPLPAGAVFSWNDPPRDGRVVTLPGVRIAEPTTPAPAPEILPTTVFARQPAVPTPAPASRSAHAAPVAVPPSPAPAVGGGEALAALLRGLDAPGLRMEALTPQTLELLGQLLRESIRGTVELLVARAALKREMRAEVTMIVSRENNPLKFSPTVEVALQHLLGPPAPGFMPAAAAVRDAMDDLRAHQLGVMAGMRAALEGVLQRFDPAQLEGKLTRKSAINSLIPATRKARLWESFTELFAQLQAEAQDDFDELFGKAFLKAYEDQLDRLHGEPGPR